MLMDRIIARLSSLTVCSHWVSSVSSLWYMVPVTLLTLAWNCPRFLELRTCYDTLQLEPDNTTLTLPRVCISHLRMDQSYSRSVTVTHPPLISFLAVSLLIQQQKKVHFNCCTSCHFMRQLQKFFSKDVLKIF